MVQGQSLHCLFSPKKTVPRPLGPDKLPDKKIIDHANPARPAKLHTTGHMDSDDGTRRRNRVFRQAAAPVSWDVVRNQLEWASNGVRDGGFFTIQVDRMMTA